MDQTVCGHWFNATFAPTGYLVKRAIIHTFVSGTEEIDAVGLYDDTPCP